MKKLYTLFLALMALATTLNAADIDRVVGADLCMIPAYEEAGDQWLDENGSVIPDIITYVRDKGWNSVRMRLFVDPSQDTEDPAVCQDYAYTLALAKRVKEAGMKWVLDFHYSDTWSDPGQQKIPASWTDHSAAALSAKMFSYTKEVVTGFIAEGVAPDFVQLGNEITYGLLWDTADGKYPTDSKEFAAAGYCTTWSSNYNAGKAQWERTASLLNNAAHAVHKAFDEAGLDSTQVKLIVHNEMSGNSKNGDNFFKHIATAGFNNYDIIGLSYYPFWNGKLEVLGSLISLLSRDFPDKPVQIVETAWYNSNYPYSADATNEFTIASLNEKWTANGQGMVNYLTDLTNKLKEYNNVTGIYYWTPEECGKGFNKTVWKHNFHRGMWQSTEQQKHPILMTADGTTPVTALATFLNDEEVQPKEDASSYFANLGFETGTLDGWIIEQEWSSQKASNISSWADPNVVEGNYSLEMWNPTQADGAIICQVASNLPNGRYTITMKARANNKGFYLYANDAKTAITAATPSIWAATTNVTNKTLEFGIGCKDKNEENYIYADAFVITRIGDATDDEDIDNTDEDEELPDNEFIDGQGIIYTLDKEYHTASVKSGRETGLYDITIPSQIDVDGTNYYVNIIEKNAFANNEYLQSITIGKSVQNIWGSAFNNCNNLRKVVFEKDSELKNIESWAFYSCNIDTLDIPAGVTTINEGTFSNCWNLRYVVLRGEVTKIENFAFSKWSADEAETAEPNACPFTDGVWIYATEAPAIAKKAFCPQDIAEATLYVHYTLVENETYTSLGFKDIQALDKSDGSIPFTDNQGVRYAAWPEKEYAEVIGFATAFGPDNVEAWEVEIPEAIVVEEIEYPVTTVAPHALENHWKLTSLTLPASLTTLGEWCFSNTAISQVSVGENVTALPVGVFSKCWNLSKVEVKGTLTSIGDFAFSRWAAEGCLSNGTALTSLTLHSTSVPEISTRAFFADDIAEGTLYVPEDLVNDDTYQALGFKQVLAIGQDGINQITVKEAVSNVLYDLCGRRVGTEKAAKGLYILNGRKVLK